MRRIVYSVLGITSTLVVATIMLSPSSASFTSQATNENNTISAAIQETTPTPSASPTNTPSPTPTTAPTPSPTPSGGIANHVVISEVQIAGTSPTQDFIELYNPTESAVILSGWKLIKRTNGVTEDEINTIDPNTSIPAHGYFLWATTGYGTLINADETTVDTLSANNSIALKDQNGNIVDQLSWGDSPTPFVEDTSFATNPSANQSLERKAVATSTESTMQLLGIDSLRGNGFDQNNNATDFILRTSAQPQNLSSSTETP